MGFLSSVAHATAAASLLGGVALLGVSCAGAAPSRSISVEPPRAVLSQPLPHLAAPMPAPEPAAPAPALQIEPVVTQLVPQVPADVPTDVPVQATAPEPVQPPAEPLPGGAAFMPEVERWRGLVRTLIAEQQAEGKLRSYGSLLNEDLVLAVVEQESGGNPDAESWAGARGLMQLMPASFAWIMGLADWGQDLSFIDNAWYFDPATNLRAGIRFLAAVLEEQNGNVYWALASYNAGGGNVNAWRRAGLTSVPEWYGGGETAAYAPAILANYSSHRPG